VFFSFCGSFLFLGFFCGLLYLSLLSYAFFSVFSCFLFLRLFFIAFVAFFFFFAFMLFILESSVGVGVWFRVVFLACFLFYFRRLVRVLLWSVSFCVGGRSFGGGVG